MHSPPRHHHHPTSHLLSTSHHPATTQPAIHPTVDSPCPQSSPTLDPPAIDLPLIHQPHTWPLASQPSKPPIHPPNSPASCLLSTAHEHPIPHSPSPNTSSHLLSIHPVTIIHPASQPADRLTSSTNHQRQPSRIHANTPATFPSLTPQQAHMTGCPLCLAQDVPCGSGAYLLLSHHTAARPSPCRAAMITLTS